MTSPLTYAEFLVAFVVVPIVGLLVAGVGIDRGRRREALAGVALMVVVATVYTVPWDNYLVAKGVWSYGEGTLLARIVHAPIEEYAFIALQPVLTALWLYRRPLPGPEGLPRVRLPRSREEATGAGGWLAVAGTGVLGLAGATYYLGAIVAWAAPVLALQWAVGGGYLWAVRRRLALAVAVPTLYLCVADRLAIGWGIWELSAQYTTGLTVGGLPVEEGLFFLATNLMLVQGLLLYHRVLETWR
jgi:lycopene cyclase domain-containing protein